MLDIDSESAIIRYRVCFVTVYEPVINGGWEGGRVSQLPHRRAVVRNFSWSMCRPFIQISEPIYELSYSVLLQINLYWLVNITNQPISDSWFYSIGMPASSYCIYCSEDNATQIEIDAFNIIVIDA